MAENQWVFTEKIDGTNIRIHFDGSSTTFGGRTDKAILPAPLLERLVELFPIDLMKETFPYASNLEKGITIYGEGYGEKIQKIGKRYLPGKQDFIIFDILIENTWLQREALQELSGLLEIPLVPIVYKGTIEEAIGFVSRGFDSTLGDGTVPAEGMVGTPEIRLLDFRASRIMTKLKTVDFKGVKE